MDKFSPLPFLILRKQLTPITTNDTFTTSARNGSEYSDSALLGCDIAQTVRYLLTFRDWMSQPNGPQQYKISLLAHYAGWNNKQFLTFRRIVQPPSSRPSPHCFRITIYQHRRRLVSSGPPIRKRRIMHEYSQVQYFR